MNDIQHNEAPNVVTETRFRTLMQQGYLAEDLCQSTAYNKSAVWYGNWVIRVVDSDRLVGVVQTLRDRCIVILLIDQFAHLALDVADECYLLAQLKADRSILERAYLGA